MRLSCVITRNRLPHKGLLCYSIVRLFYDWKLNYVKFYSANRDCYGV